MSLSFYNVGPTMWTETKTISKHHTGVRTHLKQLGKKRADSKPLKTSENL